MAKLMSSTVSAKLTVILELNESEARALDGIFGYNVDSFLKVFYERMGKHYVQPHEDGVRSLHSTIRNVVSGPLQVMDVAKKAMHQAMLKK